MGPAKVRERYLRYARDSTAAGVAFAHMQNSDKPEVWAFINEHVSMPSPWRIAEEEGGIVARDSEGKLIGALLMNAVSFDSPRGPAVLVTIRSLAVDPEWRGRGVGVVTLGMADRPVSSLGPAFYMGNCAETDARFYQRLGYTVLQSGADLPLDLGPHGMTIAIDNPNYPCCFFRESAS